MNGAMHEGHDASVEEEAPVTVDATTEADNVTYIRGKGDIGVVDFTKVCDADDVKKFRFADNELAYAFYNTYGLVVGFSVEGWLEKPPLTVYKVCKYYSEDNRWESWRKGMMLVIRSLVGRLNKQQALVVKMVDILS
ncbi:hypothetical protein RIF29_21460 [Crotalaria pallida]|uniref:Uncharacterized protein n=1 Tax=Crotalaria pallida TaxID=3830 RepID=A0AAN9F313_CROPI